MKKHVTELRAKSAADLQKEAVKLRSEIEKLAIERKVSPQKDTNMITKKKKALAVILTLMSQKKA